MNKYMIVTTEGNTTDRSGTDTDNAQIIAIIEAESLTEMWEKFRSDPAYEAYGGRDNEDEDDNKNETYCFDFDPDEYTVYQLK